MSGRKVVVRDDAGALSLIEQGEQALALVQTANEAEMLWRKMSVVEDAARMARCTSATLLQAGKLKLRAEARWGELLGPPKQGKRTDLKPLPGGKKSTPHADVKAEHKARQVAAVPKPVREKYIEKAKDPETLRRARVLRLGREDEAEKRRAEPTEPVTQTGEVEIRHGDLRQVLDDLDGQVDAIITDPPYPAEFLDEFDALAELAGRILKPDGVLVAMVGQAHLPDYIARLSAHLTYRWTGAYLTEGPATRVHHRNVGTRWKPILIYDLEGKRPFLTQDVFRSTGDDKQHHGWGQSESGMAELVERFTKPGQFVVDPFLGGGTTAVICLDLGRRFIGCDVDAAAVKTTRERLK